MPRFFGDLFYLNVDIVIDRDGCSHDASIGFDAGEGKLRPVGISCCSSGSATSFPTLPDEQELVPTGISGSGVRWLLFVLTQILEFLQLGGGQNGREFI